MVMVVVVVLQVITIARGVGGIQCATPRIQEPGTFTGVHIEGAKSRSNSHEDERVSE